MENNLQLTPNQALEVIFKLTGALQLNREQHTLLNASIGVIAGLLPAEEKGEPTND